MKRKPRLALVLGSGAARGLAHIGVIKALTEARIFPDIVVGSSIGALIGALFCKDGNISFAEEIVRSMDFKKLMSLVDPNLIMIRRGLVDGKKVKKLLLTLLGNITFSHLKIPLIVVATNLETGEEVPIENGSVVESVRASISIPVAFTPIRMGNKILIDGGVSNPVPVNIAKKIGAKKIIAVNVSYNIYKFEKINPRFTAPKLSSTNPKITSLLNKIETMSKECRERANFFKDLRTFVRNILYKKERKTKIPGIIETALQSFYIMGYHLAQKSAMPADIIIIPPLHHISTFDFYKGAECIDIGYNTTKNLIPEIKRKLRRVPI